MRLDDGGVRCDVADESPLRRSAGSHGLPGSSEGTRRLRCQLVRLGHCSETLARLRVSSTTVAAVACGSARSETRLEQVQGRGNKKEKRGEGLGLYRGGLRAFGGSKSRANRDLVAPYGVRLEDDATKKKEGKVGR